MPATCLLLLMHDCISKLPFIVTHSTLDILFAVNFFVRKFWIFSRTGSEKIKARVLY